MSAPTLLDGYELYMNEPNRVDDLDEQLVRAMQRIDHQFGKKYDDMKAAYPRTTRQYSWVLEGKQAIKDFKDWLAIRRGRLVPFWVPSWRKDMRLIKNKKDSVDLLIAGQHMAWYRAQTTRARIVMFKPDGTYIIRRILASRLSYPNTILTLNATTGIAADTTEADFPMICFLLLCRLDADAIEVHWHTKYLAEAKAILIEVPKEVPALT